MVILLFFLRLSVMGLIYSFEDLVLGIFWLSQNRVGRFCWMGFIFLCLLPILKPKKFVLCWLELYGNPIYCFLSNRLCLIVVFTTRISPQLSLSQFFCSHYLFQKASFYPRVLTLSQTCLFVLGIMLFLPALTDWLSIRGLYLFLWGSELWMPLQSQSSFLTIY